MSKLKTEVTFIEKNGRTLSKRTSYYENGQIAETGVYGIAQSDWSWNVPVGAVKSYFENGQLKSEVIYNERGTRDGESVYYSPGGEILKKLHYSNDRLIKEENFEKPVEVKMSKSHS